jgi:hypothetical protein
VRVFSGSRGLLAAALLAGAPVTAAHARDISYGWCEITAQQGGIYYQSALVQQLKGESSDDLGREFGDFARQSFASVSEYKAECWMFYSSPIDAKSHQETRQYVIETNEHKAFKLTGWTGSHAAVEAAEEESRPGPYLTVETDTSAIDARKKQEGLELQAQRDQAAAVAKRIAATARNRADTQAKLAKLFEEMRKRGSAQ